jgi:hypothetical protein
VTGTRPPAEPDQPDPRHPGPPSGDAEAPVLPDRSADERDVGWGDAGWRDADDDERYLRERPPHWE